MGGRAKAKLDELISWYEKNRPGERLPLRTGITREECERFCTNLTGELYYRGHRIIPLGEASSAPPRIRPPAQPAAR